MIRRSDIAPVKFGRRCQHLLENQAANPLAVFDQERNIVRSHLQDCVRALDIVSSIAKSRIKKSGRQHRFDIRAINSFPTERKCSSPLLSDLTDGESSVLV